MNMIKPIAIRPIQISGLGRRTGGAGSTRLDIEFHWPRYHILTFSLIRL
jgi:hypothetical protein